MPGTQPSSAQPIRSRIAAVLALALGVTGIGAAAFGIAPAAAATTGIVINEVESDGDDVDWVELANTSSAPIDISGWVIKDDDDSRTDAVPAGTTVAPGEYYVFAQPEMTFGLGRADEVRVYQADGTTLVDEFAWTQHAATTYGRCADGVGELVVTASSTRGAANDCPAVTTPTDTPTGEPTDDPAAGAVVINEVESNGDDTDWVEVYNVSDTDVNLTGYVFRDNDDSRGYVLPEGSVVPAHGFFVIDQLTAHSPGFDFGLGGADQARIFAPGGTTLVTSYEWSVHAATSYGRCPDGAGDMGETTVTTKGAPNNCALPVKINEVESSGGTPGDWIELVNLSDGALDLGGLVVTDSDIEGHRYTIPAGTEISARGYLVLHEADVDFGLGGADEVHLFAADGAALDQTAWTSHAATSWGRCTDATGEFAVTAEPTPGAVNVCAGEVAVSPWPGGQSVRVLDDEGTFGGDLSGLAYADGGLWAVENGNGLLYRVTAQGEKWLPADGWADGKKLRYRDGTGTVDAEGVTVVGDTVYVSSERNNDQGSVSRPAVLAFDPAAGSDELVATAEWNLAADFPGLGANAGLEGVTWIPDSWLVAQGFTDERTGAAYAPSGYPAHGEGVFFVGVEGTASVYAYVLGVDGSFARIATIGTDFALVAEVQFDRDLLWVVCDEACDGRTATYEIDDSGAFVATRVYARPAESANVANEGFAISSSCVDGVAQTFYADDADTDGFSLRGGTLDCTDDAGTPTPTPTDGVTPTPTDGATPTPTDGATSAPGVVVPAEDDLTDANRGNLTAPDSARQGETIRASLGAEAGATEAHVWLFSTPTALGAVMTDATGGFSVRIPAQAPLGDHRLAVTTADGQVIGWTEITIVAASEATLPATGGDGRLPALAAIGGLFALVVGVALLRRARRV